MFADVFFFPGRQLETDIDSRTPNMTDHSRFYIGAAFVAGILLTLGLKDFYPELERRFRERRRKHGSVASRVHDEDEKIYLQDSSKSPLNVRTGPPAIVEGIEGCIGNTPLLKIKSLSEETGCEILAKAEVSTSTICTMSEELSNEIIIVSQRSWTNFERQGRS